MPLRNDYLRDAAIILYGNVFLNGLPLSIYSMDNFTIAGDVTTYVTDTNITYAQNVYVRPEEVNYTVCIKDMPLLKFLEIYAIYQVFRIFVLKQPALPSIVDDVYNLFKNLGDSKSASFSDDFIAIFRKYNFLLDNITIEYQAIRQILFKQIVPANLIKELIKKTINDQRTNSVRSSLLTYGEGMAFGWVKNLTRLPTKNNVGFYVYQLTFSRVELSDADLLKEFYSNSGKKVPSSATASQTSIVPSKVELTIASGMYL